MIANLGLGILVITFGLALYGIGAAIFGVVKRQSQMGGERSPGDAADLSPHPRWQH